MPFRRNKTKKTKLIFVAILAIAAIIIYCWLSNLDRSVYPEPIMQEYKNNAEF